MRCCTLLAYLMLVVGPSVADAQTLEDRLRDVLAATELSGSVLVTKDGSTLLSASNGMANLELGVPNTLETKFRIGSITKQFTVMAILILQDRGLLDVDAAVGNYLTDIPEHWQPLTIHQLLTHTSGLMHSWSLPGFSSTMAVPTTLDATLERFFDKPLLFEPGTGSEYSGVGYFLLAKVIQEVSGKEYADFLQVEIFEPLGMDDTGADRPGPIVMNRASGYERSEDGTVLNAPDIFMPVLTGGGNLYSTVLDLEKWDRALDDHLLVSEQAYVAMYRPERMFYAYGWVVRQRWGRRVLGHEGGVPGFNALNLRIPSEALHVIVLTNATPGHARQIAQDLAATVVGDERPSGGSF